MSLGVLREYAGSLFASSPCIRIDLSACSPNTFKYFLHTETILCTAKNPNWPYSPYPLKCFPRILCIYCLVAFYAFSIDA